ncbi:MAG: flagellin, partial [Roseburia lenta]|nr:flagellin [Roseburia lenta]
ELAVQSANGTNSQTDRDAIQAEVDQLSKEIDRVSETTKFNETYLLKGDTTSTKTVTFINSQYALGTTLYDKDGTQLNKDTLKKALAAGEKVYKDNKATTLAEKGKDYAYATKLYDDAGKELTADEAAASTGELYADANHQVKVADTGAAAKTANVLRSENVNADLSFNLHVGADSESTNKIAVQIGQMSSAGIGVNGIKVSTEDDATVAVDTISAAIQKVSTQRSSLGAIQNRLEHTIDNLDNVVENTTSAESRIRDTDMADEMVKYSKNNILQQAGQSMLAQANQSTQGVLSLLQ